MKRPAHDLLALAASLAAGINAPRHYGNAKGDRVRYVGRSTVEAVDLRCMERAIAKRLRRAVHNLRNLPQVQS